MHRTRPDEIDPEWCPDCGEELDWSGVQPAGVAQFFCGNCRYRHDRFVGTAVHEAARDAPSPADDTATGATVEP